LTCQWDFEDGQIQFAISKKYCEGGAIVKKALEFVTFLLFLTIAVGQASGQDLIVYPAKGQSQQQIEKDKFDCYSWAKKQSGFDPMQAPAFAPAPSQPPPGSAAGSVVRGGAGGAALGAAVGGIAGGWSGAGKGAAIGALTGGVFGGLRSQARSYQSAQAQQQHAAQQSAQYQQKRDTYNRANSVCLEAKGYAVK
jgi:predicted lipid-binding transport protein (Tim44 family)